MRLGAAGQTAYTAGQVNTLKGMSTSAIAADCTGQSSPQHLRQRSGSPVRGTGGGPDRHRFIHPRRALDNGIIKIDWHPNNKNSLNFEWYSGGGNSTSAAFTEQYWAADFHTWANMGRAVWVFTPNATWLNEFRFGYDYGLFPDYEHECDVPGSGPNYAALGYVSGTTRTCSYESGGPGRDIWGGFPIMTVTGFTATGGSVTMQDNFEHYYTILDNASWSHGKHNVKFGTEIRLLYMNAAAMTDNQGTINFGTGGINAFTEARNASPRII